MAEACCSKPKECNVRRNGHADRAAGVLAVIARGALAHRSLAVPIVVLVSGRHWRHRLRVRWKREFFGLLTSAYTSILFKSVQYAIHSPSA